MAKADSWTQTPIRLALKACGVSIDHLKRNTLVPDTGLEGRVGLRMSEDTLQSYKGTDVQRDIDEARAAGALTYTLDYEDKMIVWWLGDNAKEYFS